MKAGATGSDDSDDSIVVDVVGGGVGSAEVNARECQVLLSINPPTA